MLRDEHRNNAIGLLMKIFTKIINNPTQTQKYGNLHSLKMMQKFAKCKPAGDLLLLSGFTPSNDKKRLIWTYNTNNMMKLQYIHATLSTMIDSSSSMKTTNSQIDQLHSTIPNLSTQNFIPRQNQMSNAYSVKINSFSTFIHHTFIDKRPFHPKDEHLLWKKCSSIRNYHIKMSFSFTNTWNIELLHFSSTKHRWRRNTKYGHGDTFEWAAHQFFRWL